MFVSVHPFSAPIPLWVTSNSQLSSVYKKMYKKKKSPKQQRDKQAVQNTNSPAEENNKGTIEMSGEEEQQRCRWLVSHRQVPSSRTAFCFGKQQPASRVLPIGAFRFSPINSDARTRVSRTLAVGSEKLSRTNNNATVCLPEMFQSRLPPLPYGLLSRLAVPPSTCRIQWRRFRISAHHSPLSRSICVGGEWGGCSLCSAAGISIPKAYATAHDAVQGKWK